MKYEQLEAKHSALGALVETMFSVTALEKDQARLTQQIQEETRKIARKVDEDEYQIQLKTKHFYSLLPRQG